MKLTAGIYTLQPAMGTIPVSSQAVVNVEAVSSEPISDVQVPAGRGWRLVWGGYTVWCLGHTGKGDGTGRANYSTGGSILGTVCSFDGHRDYPEVLSSIRPSICP